MPGRVPQLRQSFLLTGAGIALALVIGLAVLAGRSASRLLERQVDERGQDVAARVGAAVTQYLRERHHEVEELAASPAVVRAALAAEQDVARRQLTRLDVASLERLFEPRRALGAPSDPELEAYLRGYPQRSDFAEVFFTESHGYNVVTSARTSDFAQADELWWQRATADGAFEGEPRYDSSTALVAMEYDVAIRSPRAARPLGVVKAVFGLERLARLLAATDLASGAYLQVVDERGRLVATPNAADLLHPLPDAQAVPRAAGPASAVVRGAAGSELVISVPAHSGTWWVLYRQPTATAYGAVRATQRTIWLAGLALFVVTVAVLTALGRWLNRRVTEPVRAAGAIASRVAGGDLSVTVTAQQTEAAEVGELLGSVHAMVVALRRLVGAIRSAADEAAAMASQISASTEEMSASSAEMASTCQELSKRAGEQAQLVKAAADSTNTILQIVTILASGAEESVRRNSDVSKLARHHKDLLDQSTAQLAKLAEEVDRGVQEAEALARAAAEIQKFVAQTKAVATQTNMLALNAAIEAARAGPQGRGFAVVADEVRKLASLAAAAAGETADTVRGVLARVQATRDRLMRLAQGSVAARQAAQVAAEGLATMAGQADANDLWGREIAKMAAEARTLVEDIAARLTTVAQGTDGLLASAEEIAASSEQQTASTEEIASSANQLAEAADQLTGAVKTFRLLADEERPPQQQAAD